MNLDTRLTDVLKPPTGRAFVAATVATCALAVSARSTGAAPEDPVVVSQDCPPTGILPPPDGRHCVLPGTDAPSAAPVAGPTTPAQAPAPPPQAPASTTPAPAAPPAGAPAAPAAPDAKSQPPGRTAPAGRPRAPRRRSTGRRAAPRRPRRSAGRRPAARPRVAPTARPPQSTSGQTALPGLTFTPPPNPVAVPDVFIQRFPIPPFLLPIYQAAGTEYDVPWQVLAAINEIETDYGRNLNVSSAGALGWMQFMPASWRQYGVDGNGDGRKDPYNPVDAIFAAGRYLRAAGADRDLRQAIFAYNHADWYVNSVLLRAKLLNVLPADLVGSLTGLTQGHFPVTGPARYRGAGAGARFVDLDATAGAPIVAVNDGVVKAIGHDPARGRFLVLQDVYGNTYRYSHLGSVAASYPAPRPHVEDAVAAATELDVPTRDPRPTRAASAGRQRAVPRHGRARARVRPAARAITVAKQRLFAHPGRPRAQRAGGSRQLARPGASTAARGSIPPGTRLSTYFSVPFSLKPSEAVMRRLAPGAQVIGGTVLGRAGAQGSRRRARVRLEVRPAGRGAPLIDPKPVLDGWRLLGATGIYRSGARNAFFGPGARNPTIGQILLMSKESLERVVLADRRIRIYPCGRTDIQAGAVDRRVLATLAFLAASGLKPLVSALKCGHSYYTTAGTVSEHSSGNALDIASINGTAILGHQGPGSITDTTIRRLLTLQGAMKPHQIISLMTYPGADNTLSLSDHADHIHVGFAPGAGAAGGGQSRAVLKPRQWGELMRRLGQMGNPAIPGVRMASPPPATRAPRLRRRALRTITPTSRLLRVARSAPRLSPLPPAGRGA